MKKFIKSLFFFLLPILVIAVAIELLERNIPNSYALKDKQLKNKAENITTLVLGSSHSYYGVNPALLSSPTFNFSAVSQTVDIDKKVLKTYLEKLPYLKTVIIRLSYATLYEQLKHTNEAWRIKDYEIYTDVELSNKLKYQSEVLTMKLENNLNDIYNYYGKNEDLLKTTNLGWGKELHGKFEGNLKTIGKKVAQKHTFTDEKYFSDNIASFKKIVETCSKKDINVIIITFPAHHSYVKNLQKKQLEQTVNTGKLLQQKYKNCYYFNFLEDKSFNANDFYDADHLNHQGAEKMAVIIDKIIEQDLK